jgi:hypothetical protein
MSEITFGGNDYQFGHCHYFAKYLIRVFKEMLPDVDVKYHMVLAERYDNDDEVIDDVLIHVYLKVGEYLIDSEGVFSIDEASKREQSWADDEKDLTPDGDDFSTWEEQSDNIPEMFFNRFCSTKQLKKDVLEFVKRPDVVEVINKYK